MADFPELVATGTINSAGGTPTDDDPGFSGAGLETGDKIILFTCYGSFAFAAINFPDAADTRVWHEPVWGNFTYPGAGPYFKWTVTPKLYRYDGDDSNIRMSGNSPPNMLVWMAYRGLNVFTNCNLDGGVAAETDSDYSGVNTDTLSVVDRLNTCTGGKNVSWLTFASSEDDTVPVWPAGVTEVVTFQDSGFGTISIAEQRVNGSGDWPAVTMSYSGSNSLGLGDGICLRRFVPLFRQDGDEEA